MSKFKKIISVVFIVLVLALASNIIFRKINSAPRVENLELVAPKAETVYGFMADEEKDGKLTFTEKDYAGMGAFINSINGIKSGNGKDWILYVNGKESMVGVSNYTLKPGDTITWKYETDY